MARAHGLKLPQECIANKANSVLAEKSNTTPTFTRAVEGVAVQVYRTVLCSGDIFLALGESKSPRKAPLHAVVPGRYDFLT